MTESPLNVWGLTLTYATLLVTGIITGITVHEGVHAAQHHAAGGEDMALLFAPSCDGSVVCIQSQGILDAPVDAWEVQAVLSGLLAQILFHTGFGVMLGLHYTPRNQA